GWGDPAAAVHQIAGAGAAGVQLEDQVPAKLCGHLPGKQLVSPAEMVARVRAAVAGKPGPEFVVMARTDAFAVEGLPAAIARARAYVSAGADMIFAEALPTLDVYRAFTNALAVPVLANLTEFGQTPLFTVDELRRCGIALALYPLSASRAAAAASLQVYQTLRRDGTQQAAIATMQTRADLYATLGYTPPKQT
ncbi:MAG: isocitrate lyase/phosphoenolpyruvate mutase family protein, partial [Opitutales bacterium]